MIQCKDCKYFEPIAAGHWSGDCTITLPVWVVITLNNVHDCYTTVRADDGCDLGVNHDQ